MYTAFVTSSNQAKLPSTITRALTSFQRLYEQVVAGMSHLAGT